MALAAIQAKTAKATETANPQNAVKNTYKIKFGATSLLRFIGEKPAKAGEVLLFCDWRSFICGFFYWIY